MSVTIFKMKQGICNARRLKTLVSIQFFFFYHYFINTSQVVENSRSKTNAILFRVPLIRFSCFTTSAFSHSHFHIHSFILIVVIPSKILVYSDINNDSCALAIKISICLSTNKHFHKKHNEPLLTHLLDLFVGHYGGKNNEESSRWRETGHGSHLHLERCQV